MLRNNNFARFMTVATVSTILLTTTLIFMISNIAITPTTIQYQAFAKSSHNDKNTSKTVAKPMTENDGTGTGADHVAIVGVKHARSFSPNPIDVRVGDTVTWTNDHRESHTVTSSSGFDSGIIESGQSFSHTFDKTGTFQYYCELHPSMVGKVNVS